MMGRVRDRRPEVPWPTPGLAWPVVTLAAGRSKPRRTSQTLRWCPDHGPIRVTVRSASSIRTANRLPAVLTEARPLSTTRRRTRPGGGRTGRGRRRRSRPCGLVPSSTARPRGGGKTGSAPVTSIGDGSWPDFACPIGSCRFSGSGSMTANARAAGVSSRVAVASALGTQQDAPRSCGVAGAPATVPEAGAAGIGAGASRADQRPERQHRGQGGD